MFADIWSSFRRLPLWVQIWVAVILGPVNMVSVFLVTTHPSGAWIASLAWLGMLFNLPILFRERGFSKAMAFPHVLLWTPLIFVLIDALDNTIGSVTIYLWLLLLVNLVSLLLDYTDAIRWLRGERSVA